MTDRPFSETVREQSIKAMENNRGSPAPQHLSSGPPKYDQFAFVSVTRFEIDHLRNLVVLLDHGGQKRHAASLQEWIEDKTSRPSIPVASPSSLGSPESLTAEELEYLQGRLPPPFADGTQDRFSVIAGKLRKMELEAIAYRANLSLTPSGSPPELKELLDDLWTAGQEFVGMPANRDRFREKADRTIASIESLWASRGRELEQALGSVEASAYEVVRLRAALSSLKDRTLTDEEFQAVDGAAHLIDFAYEHGFHEEGFDRPVILLKLADRLRRISQSRVPEEQK